jgi:hypothetical protein
MSQEPIDLLTFLEVIVNNPQERALYQADPAVYLSAKGFAPDSRAAKALMELPRLASPVLEVSTVIRTLVASAQPDAQITATEQIPIPEIVISTPNYVFLAEKSPTGTRNHIILPNSYVTWNKQKNIAFVLNILYFEQEYLGYNPMFQITCNEGKMFEITQLFIGEVQLDLSEYMLVKRDRPVRIKNPLESYYDPASNQLFLTGRRTPPGPGDA